MSFILKLLGGALGPYLLGGAGVLLALSMATAGVQGARLKHAKADLSNARAALINPVTRKTWQSEAVRDARDLGICRGNVGSLTASLSAQNAAVTSLKADGDRRAAMLSEALQQRRRVVAEANRRGVALMDLKPKGADVCARMLDVDKLVRENAR